MEYSSFLWFGYHVRDMRGSFNSLQDVMMIINPDFTIEKINQSGLDLLGLPEEEVIGQKCCWLFRKVDEPEKTCSCLKTQHSKKVESEIWYGEHFDRHFAVKSSPIFDDNGDIVKFVDLMQDVTDLRRTQEQLQEAIATKNRFFSIISHDLKNPLIAFQSGLDMLNDHIQNLDDDFVQELSGDLLKRSHLLLEFLKKLLTWSRMQSGSIPYKPEILELAVPVQYTVQLHHKNATQKNITITSQIEEETMVFADYNMVNAIIGNLLSNAIKFTNDGGTITITSRDAGDYLEIAVIDDGIGMTRENQQKLFRVGEENISRQGTAGEPGTGLGLLLCKEFVEKHTGQIWVESDVGHGSTFTFTLLKTEP